jgi:purine-binding chemotaxis protein CheW
MSGDARIRPKVDALSAEAFEVLNRRAERLRSKKVEEESEDSTLWIAEFVIGEEPFGIPLSALRAAVPLRMVTPVPLSAPHVIGVLRFQDQMISALSLSSLLGGRGWRQDPQVLLVVDPGWGHLTALDCEQIPKPAALPLAAVEAARAAKGGPVLEVTTKDMRQVNLIDLTKLLDRRAAEVRHGA